MTFSGKILRSIVVFSMGAILSFYGFQSKAHSQPESAVTAIAVVFCVGVIALALAAIVFSKQMKLDRKAHLVVLQEVARIKAGGKISDIAPDVRVIVEDLVGHRYEECWGNSKLFKDAAPAPAQTVVPIKEEGPAGIRRGLVLMRFFLWSKLQLNQRDRFCTARRVTGSAEAGWLAKSIAFS